MKLSVIIPAYNAADTISTQLDALASQRWNYPWEVLLIDNHSTDNTKSIAKSYQNKIANLRIIDAREKQGVSYARNKGVEASKGEYVAFCDADDAVGENWAAAIGEALFANDFVACRMEWTKLNDRTIAYRREMGQSSGLMNYPIVKFLPHAGGGTLGVKKELHNKVGGFDEELAYLEDTDYCWKIQLLGVELTFLPQAFIHIRDRGSRLGMFKQSMHWAEYNVRLYKKYRDKGMPDYPLKKGLLNIYALLLTSPQLFKRKKQQQWIRRLGAQVGRIKGAVKYRVFVF